MKDFKFKLRGTTWKVSFVAEDDPSLEGNLGITSHVDHAIYLNKDVKIDLIFTTLWHEIIHAALNCVPSGVELQEEIVCNLVADAVYELMQQKTVAKHIFNLPKLEVKTNNKK